jgi:hypothetical protein
MQRWRWVLATAIVVGLGALVAVLIQSDPVPTTTTIVITTTTTSTPTTATSAATTVTTADQRSAEVETILQELWFGWFDAIHRKDADALWEVVATTPRFQSGRDAIASMTFVEPPSVDAIQITNASILLDREDCLVVAYGIDVSSFRGPGSITDTVSVMWPDERYGWRIATAWNSPSDLWMQDCDNMVRESTP